MTRVEQDSTCIWKTVFALTFWRGLDWFALVKVKFICQLAFTDYLEETGTCMPEHHVAVGSEGAFAAAE